MENRLSGLEALKTKTLDEIGRLEADTAHARDDIGKPFSQAGQLAAARDRVRQIGKQLEEAAMPPSEQPRLAGAAMHDAAAGIQNANGDDAPARADVPISIDVVRTISGMPMKQGGNGTGASSGQSPAVAGDRQSSEAAEIAQRGFPEPNPLVEPAGLRAIALSRPAERADRNVRQMR